MARISGKVTDIYRLELIVPYIAIITATSAIKTEKGLAISGLGNLVLLSFNKIFPTAKNAITVKNDRAYTPANGSISPFVTNKTEIQSKKKSIRIL